MGIGAAIGGVASAVIGSKSAKDASKAQGKAADQQVALQRDIYESQKELFAPYRESGELANQAVNYLMGLGDAPMIGAQDPLEVTENRLANPDYIAPRVEEFRGDGSVAPPRAGNGLEPYITQYSVGDRTFSTRSAADAYANEGVNPGTPWAGFQADPGYQFRLSEGQRATEAAAASRHGLVSGATLEALDRNAQGFASNEYGNFFNRLSGIAQRGQASAAGQAAAGQNYASGASNALANKGDAAAAGAIGVGNALQGSINNGLGVWAYGKGNGWWGQ